MCEKCPSCHFECGRERPSRSMASLLRSAVHPAEVAELLKGLSIGHKEVADHLTAALHKIEDVAGADAMPEKRESERSREPQNGFYEEPFFPIINPPPALGQEPPQEPPFFGGD